MATFHELAPGDIKTARSFLNQLIDVLQEDVSGSTSRRKYQHFVTGGVGPGVTSSLFQTVYDQDFTLQTANAVFDVTIGLAPETSLTTGIAAITKTETDASGKALYPSSSLMMREKVDIYRQFAQTLLGSGDSLFKVPLEGTSTTTVDAAMFIAFKRLFSRDQIKRETFAMRFYQTASAVSSLTAGGAHIDMPVIDGAGVADQFGITNLNKTSLSGSAIFTDLGSSTQKFTTLGGQYGIIVDSARTSRQVGLMFYDAGVAVFDLAQIVSGSQFMSGTIDAMHPTGKLVLGNVGTQTEYKSKFLPDFVTSGSIDNVVDHLCSTRFQSGSLTAITFQNVTNINSSLIFCRAPADEFNYSSNPTFVDTTNNSRGRIVVIDPGEEDKQESFTFVTGIGMYDAAGNLLAVAKLSRPVEKSSERDLTFRVRLDF
jgi:hypothetical protein